jgi:hypothetical protein
MFVCWRHDNQPNDTQHNVLNCDATTTTLNIVHHETERHHAERRIFYCWAECRRAKGRGALTLAILLLSERRRG